MMQTLHVQQSALFFRLDDEDNWRSSSSESYSSDEYDDEIEDPSFVVDNERDDEQPWPSSTPTKSRQTPTKRGLGWSSAKSRSPARDDEQPWPSSTPTKRRQTPTKRGLGRSPAKSRSPARDDEQPLPSSTPTKSRQTPTKRGLGWSSAKSRSPASHFSRQTPTKRGLGRSPAKSRSPARSRSPAQSGQPHHSSEPWKTESDPDTAPKISRFMPRRTPGVQVNMHSVHSPMDLFQLYFSTDTMRTLCKNTNKQARRNLDIGSKYKWTDIGVEELYKFLGLLMYTSLVSLSSIQDYWKRNHLMSVPFPATVMTRDRFRSIMWNIHPSDPEEDVRNDQKKGTPQYDKLFRVKPLMDDIQNACRAHYHPRKEVSVDERMVATKAKTGMTQYMKDKPTKWGIKLFVLAESSNGYTLNFNVYKGKSLKPSVHGLGYDAVMDLILPSHLGTGYHVYVDNFYTSPKLFLKLASMNFGACGTYRDNMKGKECPSGRANAIHSQSKRGTVRWIREDTLVFVKWMDTREVSVCSTIHPAFSGDAVKRRVKGGDGLWAVKDIPCPTPIIAYNKNMGGVDLSDQLLQYYSTHRRTARWYRTLFMHFVDIATTNAYILHKEIGQEKKLQAVTHKNFQIELVSQLCGVDMTGVPIRRSTDHVPVAIVVATDVEDKATQGRRSCRRCNIEKKRNLTPWKCKACDVALCLILDRNCFEEWHR